MKALLYSLLLVAPLLGRGPGPRELGASPLPLGEPGIAWYPRLEDGLKEALRSNKPILFMAVASQCNGVPGIF